MLFRSKVIRWSIKTHLRVWTGRDITLSRKWYTAFSNLIKNKQNTTTPTLNLYNTPVDNQYQQNVPCFIFLWNGCIKCYDQKNQDQKNQDQNNYHRFTAKTDFFSWQANTFWAANVIPQTRRTHHIQ